MKVISILILTTFLSPCFADFVIHTGETVVVTQTLTDPGDVGLIEEGGVISTAAPGVLMNGNNQTVLNKGTIITQAVSARGIFLLADNQVGVNEGLIRTTGTNSSGLATAMTDSNVLLNNGTIITTGNQSHALATNGSNNNVLINNGSLFASGVSSNGINVLIDTNAFALNTGTIRVTGNVGIGILSTLGNNIQIVNSGSIIADLLAFRGIFVTGSTNVNVVNSGAISAALIAFESSGATNVNLVNSGTLRGGSGVAISFLNTVNPSLMLQRGSNIQGLVSSSNPLNLSVESGLNLALSLVTGQTFLTQNIEDPFVVVGNTIAVVDPTGLALQADVVADLSDTVLGSIYQHHIPFSCCSKPCGCGVWAEAIGSYRKRNEGSASAYRNWQGGFLVGYDKPLWGGTAGVFGGATFGKAKVEENTQQADIDNYVAGLTYEAQICQSFLGSALALGYVRIDNDRTVMNNLAPNGVETATSHARGFFISPELTCAQRFPNFWHSPYLSGTLRYAGLYLGSYNEHGSLTNLSVRHRNLHLLNLRGELGLPFGKKCGDGCWTAAPYLGVLGRFQVADKTVDGELLGVPLSFDPGGPRNLAAFLVGFRGEQKLGCLTVFLNVETSFDNYRSTRVLGEGGVGFDF